MSLGLYVDGVDESCHAWTPVRIVWGRRHPGESLDPRRILGSADLAAGIARGAVVDLVAGAPATNPRWETSVGTWQTQPAGQTWRTQAVLLRLFHGRVTDTVTTWRPLDDTGQAHEVTTDYVGMDPVADLAGALVGAASWPLEAVEARARRILDAAGIAGTVHTAGAQRVAARDPDTQPALDLLDDLAAAVSIAGGVWWNPDTALLEWFTDAQRATRSTTVRLTCAEILDDLEWITTAADVVNAYTVRYRSAADPLAGLEVTVTDSASVLANGHRASSISTDLVDLDDARERAAEAVARYGRAAPRFERVTVPLRLLDRERAETLLRLGPYARVELADLPDPAPTTWYGWVEGAEVVVDGPEWTDWTVTLNLSPSAWGGPLITWAEVTPGITWVQVAPAFTWLDATDTIEWSA